MCQGCEITMNTLIPGVVPAAHPGLSPSQTGQLTALFCTEGLVLVILSVPAACTVESCCHVVLFVHTWNSVLEFTNLFSLPNL